MSARSLLDLWLLAFTLQATALILGASQPASRTCPTIICAARAGAQRTGRRAQNFPAREVLHQGADGTRDQLDGSADKALAEQAW